MDQKGMDIAKEKIIDLKDYLDIENEYKSVREDEVQRWKKRVKNKTRKFFKVFVKLFVNNTNNKNVDDLKRKMNRYSENLVHLNRMLNGAENRLSKSKNRIKRIKKEIYKWKKTLKRFESTETPIDPN